MKKYAYDMDEIQRTRIVASLQASYDRYDPLQFERGLTGGYPKLGAGKSQDVFEWVFPAVHLTLEPRPGRETADRELARKMLVRAILQAQFRKDGDPADGSWNYILSDGENPYPRDRNIPGFMGMGLARIWALDRRRLDDWPAEDFAVFKEAVRRSTEVGFRHWVRLGYTNPQCIDFYLAWVAADLLDEPRYREMAREHLRKFIAYARTTDSFEEWISPTYIAVNLGGLVPLAHYTRGTSDGEAVRELLDFQWRLVGAAVHGPSGEICGPLSRAYKDTLLEAGEYGYAWMHLAAPALFKLDKPEEMIAETSRHPFSGFAATGLYVPLNIPEDVKTSFRSPFEVPVEERETFEWIGRCSWEGNGPSDLSKPEEPAPRFRLGTRYRAARYCVGSVNELDGWEQRRPCLAYWKQSGGSTTGLKWHVRVETGQQADESLNDWLFMEAVEYIGVQSGNEVIGAFRTAPVVPARPGDVLQAPAETFSIGRRGRFRPKNPAGWFLGTHWRQPIEPEWQRQKLDMLWIGITPIGQGNWIRLNQDGTRWVFHENGVEAVIETAAPARLASMANQTRGVQPVDCLELWRGEKLDWDWLNLPHIFTPFGLVVQEQGLPRVFGLLATGDNQACEVARGGLKLKWLSPSRPDGISVRTWWGWMGGKEILPRGFSR